MHRSTYDLSYLNELARDPDIFSTWLGVIGGVLVHQDDRSRVGQDDRLENMQGLDERSGQSTDADLE